MLLLNTNKTYKIMTEKEMKSMYMTESTQGPDVAIVQTDLLPIPTGHDIHKGLDGRHMTMIALGGTLEIGLLVGT